MFLKIFDCKYVAQFISQVPIHVHLIYFQASVIVNSAAVNKRIHWSFQRCAFLFLSECIISI